MKFKEFLNSLNPDKLFRNLPDDVFREFEHNIRLRNARSVKIIAIISIGFLFLTMILDSFRYREGLFQKDIIYTYLFFNHLLFALQFVPLILLTKNRTAIEAGSYPFLRQINTFSILAGSITLLCMTTLTILERGSVLIYGIYILLINFLVLLPHRWRIRFNLISFLFILVAILYIYRENQPAIASTLIEIIGITIPGFLISTYRYNDTIKQFLVDKRLKEQKRIIEFERERSDQLLRNILPDAIAKELKEKGKVQPKYHEKIAILFSDFKGYTALSKEMSPEDLVMELDSCFSAFDQIIKNHGLEKIKTLGDGYFCIGGVDETGDDAMFRIIEAAKAMIQFMKNRKIDHTKKNLPAFDLRIGIHCGPAVAGVVGKSKFTYDIWGSTVNIASRMETTGAIGRINISEDLYQIVKSRIPCTPRGKIKAKGLGMTPMYFVD